jgi:hypothetical protein
MIEGRLGGPAFLCLVTVWSRTESRQLAHCEGARRLRATILGNGRGRPRLPRESFRARQHLPFRLWRRTARQSL